METNMTAIETATKAITGINKLFEAIDEDEAKRGKGSVYGRKFGYAGIPNCLVRAHEVGADKVFLVNSDYHGRHEDDDCLFTYWDEVNKEFFNDEWSTRFAAPNYTFYEMPVMFVTAWEAGLIDKETYLNVVKNMTLESITKKEWPIRPFDIDHNVSPEKLIGIKVTVSGGRKWKGTGYLVKVFKKTYRFATPMFRNHSKDFGLSTSYTAVIFDPETNTINECSLGQIRFTEADEIIAAYKAWASEIVNNATTDDITGKFKMWIGLNYSFDTFLAKWIEEHKPDWSTASYPAQEERDRQAAEFAEKKIAELINWVREKHPEENEEWIKSEAERIFHKNYDK